ncbi:MAG TPA: hypothetical protein VD993_19465 [Chitinophagaceae bacterium]|nr:hypothetical protein [Chitinophagaceae bacterium]
MKSLACCCSFLLWACSVLAQNVGVGETSPGAKLTIRSSDPSSRSMLVKTTSNDTTLYIQGFNHHLGAGSNIISSASLTVNNKNFVPFDNTHLSLIAWGERSGINAAGSLAIMDFRNVNSNARYNFSAYLGAAAAHSMGLYYNDVTAGTSKALLYFTQDGYTGIGTFQPSGRMQINHTSGTGNPTLNLYDSATTGGPILQFRNAGSSRNWQLQGYLASTPAGDEMNFVNNNTLLATMTGSGNFGIGTNGPQNKLHLHNTTGTQTSYTQFTNTSTGSLSGDGLLTGINGVGHAFIYNQEATRLYFGTGNTTRMTVSETGNVGIGIDPPTERLDVVGNIKSSGSVNVGGEVTRPATGGANLVPIAYGNITSGGVINSGSGNFTVSRLTTGWYSITITGESYQFQIYTAIVTPAGNVGPISTNTGSGGGNLHVYTYNSAGAAADSQFCFVVYKQ